MQKTSSPTNLRKLIKISVICTTVIAALAAIAVEAFWPLTASAPLTILGIFLYSLAQNSLILATSALVKTGEFDVKQRNIFLALVTAVEIIAIGAIIIGLLLGLYVSNRRLVVPMTAFLNFLLWADLMFLCALIMLAIGIVAVYVKTSEPIEPDNLDSSQPIMPDERHDAISTENGISTVSPDATKNYRGVFCIPLFCCIPFLIYGMQVTESTDTYAVFSAIGLLVLCIAMAVSTLPALGFIISFVPDWAKVFLMVVAHILAVIFAVLIILIFVKDSLIWEKVLVITVAIVSAVTNIIAIHQTRKHLC